MNEKMNETPLFKTEEGKQAVFDFYDKLLADWGMDYEAQFVPTEFGETHVISVGENGAPPLVLLHGSSSNATMWLADMKVFAKDFRVHAVDIVGQPGKSAEVRPDLNGDGYALWMRDVLHGLGLSKAALMGNSLGGWVALKFASCFPEMVERLVLVATSGVTNLRLSSTLKMLVHAMRGEKGMLRIQQLVYGDDELPEVAIVYTSLMMEHFVPFLDPIPVFSDEVLGGLAMPVFFIGGENDFFMNSQKTADRLTALLENVQTNVIADNGHVVYGVTEMVTPFLLK
jgi:pimeloyl-ACP methyl ester carboxylesterase